MAIGDHTIFFGKTVRLLSLIGEGQVGSQNTGTTRGCIFPAALCNAKGVRAVQGTSWSIWWWGRGWLISRKLHYARLNIYISQAFNCSGTQINVLGTCDHLRAGDLQVIVSTQPPMHIRKAHTRSSSHLPSYGGHLSEYNYPYPWLRRGEDKHIKHNNGRSQDHILLSSTSERDLAYTAGPGSAIVSEKKYRPTRFIRHERRE